MTNWEFDPTTNPALRSWVTVPNDSPFPIQALPYGVVRSGNKAHVVVRIGDHVLLLAPIAAAGLLGSELTPLFGTFATDSLLPFIGLGPAKWLAVRRAVSTLLAEDGDGATFRGNDLLRGEALLPLSAVEVLPPLTPPNYTDFYASVHHARNVGSMLRPDSPLMPNYLYLPVGYHGRASSVVVSGTKIRRPCGQILPTPGEPPVVKPSGRLDYELELGVIVGVGNEHGVPVALDDAWSRVFGIVIVNDWSARDIQGWEYQPLGPFLAKNFATSISAWVLPAIAIEPFACPMEARPEGAPALLEYLDSPSNRLGGGLNITVQAHLLTPAMRARGVEPTRISTGSFRHMTWSFAQMIAHHTRTGCNLVPGDLLASGTVSGPEPESGGCLLELTWDRKIGSLGRTPLQLAGGETRIFLQDGDEVTLSAAAHGQGYCIGLGPVTGVVLPALEN